jgi:hypothetical protein
VLLSEARLRERRADGDLSAEQVLAAAGHGHGTAQLWWLELAQRTRAEKRQAQASADASADGGRREVPDGVSGGGEAVGRRLAERSERVASLEGQVRDTGLEVVFLRQELIARDLELRRVKADAEANRSSSARRIASLEGAVRSTGAEQETKVRELEQSCRQLSGRTDLHALLAQTKQALAAERVAAVHREGKALTRCGCWRVPQ